MKNNPLFQTEKSGIIESIKKGIVTAINAFNGSGDVVNFLRAGIRPPVILKRFAATLLLVEHAKAEEASMAEWEAEGGSLGIPQKS